MAPSDVPSYLSDLLLVEQKRRATVSQEENWVFQAQGRTVTMRVCLEETGAGATILRYAIHDGPAQGNLNVVVASREEARLWLLDRVEQLLGPDVPQRPRTG